MRTRVTRPASREQALQDTHRLWPLLSGLPGRCCSADQEPAGWPLATHRVEHEGLERMSQRAWWLPLSQSASGSIPGVCPCVHVTVCERVHTCVHAHKHACWCECEIRTWAHQRAGPGLRSCSVAQQGASRPGCWMGWGAVTLRDQGSGLQVSGSQGPKWSARDPPQGPTLATQECSPMWWLPPEATWGGQPGSGRPQEGPGLSLE